MPGSPSSKPACRWDRRRPRSSWCTAATPRRRTSSTWCPRLERPNLTYLAPAAANRTWYPHSFMAEIAGNEPGLSSGLAVLDSLVDRIQAAGIPRSRIVLLGFSQGACLAAEFAVRHASRFGGVVVFSGGVIGPPGTRWDYPGRFDGTPVFLGCSDRGQSRARVAGQRNRGALHPHGRRGDQAHLSGHGAPGERRRDRLRAATDRFWRVRLIDAGPDAARAFHVGVVANPGRLRRRGRRAAGR